MGRLLVCAALSQVVLGCGASPPPSPSEPLEVSPPADSPSVSPPAASPRELGADATFADLVNSARNLDGEARQESPCVLRHDATRIRIVGDLSGSLRPLPEAPARITLSAPGPVRVFSQWGQQGEGSTVLAAFSGSAPPRRGSSLAVLLHATSADIRSTDASLSLDGLDDEHAIAAIREGFAAGATRLFVSAEAEVRLSRLFTLLEALPEDIQHASVFALVLPVDVALPSAPSRGLSDTGMCSAEAPRTPGPSGTPDAAALQRSLRDALRGGALCLNEASPESAMGGRLFVRVIVDAQGEALSVCATQDELGDSGVRTCVLDLVRQAQFPPSDGEVTVGFPVSLAPDRSDAPRLSCPNG